MKKSAILVAALIAHLVTGMQRFDRQPRYTEANIGDTVVLECSVFNKKGQCVWQKDGKPVGIYSNKYEWIGSPEKGDCSLKILQVKPEFDAGDWECQVTASAFDAQDALTSEPAPLVIRIPPTSPHFEVNYTQIGRDSNLTVSAGIASSVQCVSRAGNPAPLLKWFLGDRELLTHNQTNTTEGVQPKTFSAISTLIHTFNKTDNLHTLKCIAIHEAFPAKYRETSTKVNVLYAPEVTLVANTAPDVEENLDSAIFRCVSDSNPPAAVFWRKINADSLMAVSGDVHIFQESLEFSPVTRKDSGTYSCEARNVIGSSNLITVHLDVKYPPSIVSVGPAVGQQLTLALYETTTMQCRARGNPQPKYRWLHKRRTNDLETITVASEAKDFTINNVTYDNQGEYVCVATNFINGTERLVQSEAITVRIVGPPQILRDESSAFQTVERGDDIVLRSVFCSDPRPYRISWNWAGFQVEAGAGHGRFVAEVPQKVNTFANFAQTLSNETTALDTLHPFLHAKREDCFESRLKIRNVDFLDARHYSFTVENDKGSDTVFVGLAVKEPVSMVTVIAVVIASLFIIIIFTLCLVYAHHSGRCCFHREKSLKPTDIESMKSDGESVHSSSQCSSSSTSGLKSSKAAKINVSSGSTSTLPAETSPTNPTNTTTPFKTNITINGAYVEIQQPGTTNPFTVPAEVHYDFQRRSSIKKTTADYRGLLYADLQLPKISNNGSMKVKRGSQHWTPSNSAIMDNTIDFSFESTSDVSQSKSFR